MQPRAEAVCPSRETGNPRSFSWTSAMALCLQHCCSQSAPCTDRAMKGVLQHSSVRWIAWAGFGEENQSRAAEGEGVRLNY